MFHQGERFPTDDLAPATIAQLKAVKAIASAVEVAPYALVEQTYALQAENTTLRAELEALRSQLPRQTRKQSADSAE